MFGGDMTSEEEARLDILKPVIPVTQNWLVRSFIKLFESLLLGKDTREGLAKKEQELRDKEEAKKDLDKLRGGSEQ